MFHVDFKTRRDWWGRLGVSGRSGPFSTRAVAEEHANALLKRKDVFPPINIVEEPEKKPRARRKNGGNGEGAS